MDLVFEGNEVWMAGVPRSGDLDHLRSRNRVKGAFAFYFRRTHWKASMTQLVRLCPKCGTEREPHEIVCSESVGDGTICGFSLLNIKRTKSRRDLVSVDTSVISTDSAADDTLNSVRLCPNGHEVEEGDVDCITCGASLSANLAAQTETKELPDGPNSWSIRSQLESESENAELYSVLHSETGQAGLLRWFAHGLEPGTRIYRVLEHLTHPNITRLVDRGRDYGRAWEVWEVTDGEALADVLGRGDLTRVSTRAVYLTDELCIEPLGRG